MAIATELLHSVPLFAGMTERAIAAVREVTRTRTFATGEALVRQGAAGDSFLRDR
jgi:CRP-like cAMP-binding protein